MQGRFRSVASESVPLEKGVLEQLTEKLSTVWTEYNKVRA